MNLNVKDIITHKWNNSKLIPHENPESRYNRNTVLKNYENFDGIFEIILDFDNGDQNVELMTNIGITNSFITAVECLGASLYSPSVLFASITIECILNHDLRLEDYRISLNKNLDYQWIMLGKDGLMEADKQKLPVRLLCNSNDDFPNNIAFVKRRNKIAHGDTEGYKKIHGRDFDSDSFISTGYTTDSWQPTKEDALDQIKKTKNFVEAWGKSHPKLRHH